MNLTPSDAARVRALLHDAPVTMTTLALSSRLDEEAPPLGAHVFRLVCKLGSDAGKEMRANLRERKSLREQLGKKALPKGVGPARVKPVFAPTLNEYNALDKWKKGELCDSMDAEIATLRRQWPEWSCGSVDHSVERPGKTAKCRPCKGSGGIARKRKNGPAVTTPCGDCGGTGRIGAAPLLHREGGRRRVVVVTRESSKRPDELATDSIGGKVCLDRLVQAGVLRGDTAEWLVRYCDWKECPPSDGKVTVDVYEVGAC